MKLRTMAILSQMYKAFLNVSVRHLLSWNIRLVESVGDISSQSQHNSLNS